MSKDNMVNLYQQQAFATGIYPNKGGNIFYPVLGLAGEAGEIANKVKKIMRDFDGKVSADMRDAIMDECGDVLWYVAAICSELGVDLSEVMVNNLAKVTERQKRNVIGGSGDNR